MDLRVCGVAIDVAERMLDKFVKTSFEGVREIMRQIYKLVIYERFGSPLVQRDRQTDDLGERQDLEVSRSQADRDLPDLRHAFFECIADRANLGIESFGCLAQPVELELGKGD